MRLELIFSMSLVSVIYGNAHSPTDMRFSSAVHQNRNIDVSPQKHDNSEYEPVSRRRRTIHGWKIAEPLYVDEPKWIIIEESNHPQVGQRYYVNNKFDPFYITRGKRITTNHLRDYKRTLGNGAVPLDTKTHLEDNISNNSDLLMHYQLNRIDTVPVMQNNKLHLRNKHSDIMELLQEPFVISRGKKASNERGDHVHFLDPLTLDADTPSRNRRGKLLDQLMKEKDPFYVARGKRHFQF